MHFQERLLILLLFMVLCNGWKYLVINDVICYSLLCRVRQFDSVERELAVNAAAASIYSTCNYLLSGS